MKVLLSLLLICSFFVLLLGGLLSVLRDMMRRDWVGGRAAEALDFDLSRDFDHSLRREIEPVDNLCRVAVEKRK